MSDWEDVGAVWDDVTSIELDTTLTDLFDGSPIPLVPQVKILPFPVASLPAVLERMVRAVAEETQTDPGMAGVTVLGVLSSAAGGAVLIEARGGWREPLVLQTAIIAAPGERKSGVQARMIAPLFDAEEDLVRQAEPGRIEDQTLHAIAVKDAERVLAEAAKATTDKDKKKAEAVAAALKAGQMRTAPLPRLLADDITPEAAASLVAEQQRLAIVSAEGGIFDTLAGRYSGSIPNIELFLKGHSGDQLKVDRKGRPPEFVKQPALTVSLMVQPTVIDAISSNPVFRGRGLLARFLYSQPTSFVGYRNSRAEPVPAPIDADYREFVQDLVVSLAKKVGNPALLTLTPAARDQIHRILEETEILLQPGATLDGLRDWGSKYVGAVLRIAGLLHLAEHSDRGTEISVSADTITSAEDLGRYFMSHAIKVFGGMQLSPEVADMLFAVARIAEIQETEEVRDGVRAVSLRQIHRATRSRLTTIRDVRDVVENLVDRCYLASLPEPEAKGAGRPRSPRYLVHPDVAMYAPEGR